MDKFHVPLPACTPSLVKCALVHCTRSLLRLLNLHNACTYLCISTPVIFTRKSCDRIAIFVNLHYLLTSRSVKWQYRQKLLFSPYRLKTRLKAYSKPPLKPQKLCQQNFTKSTKISHYTPVLHLAGTAKANFVSIFPGIGRTLNIPRLKQTNLKLVGHTISKSILKLFAYFVFSEQDWGSISDITSVFIKWSRW